MTFSQLKTLIRIQFNLDVRVDTKKNNRLGIELVTLKAKQRKIMEISAFIYILCLCIINIGQFPLLIFLVIAVYSNKYMKSS